MTPPDDSLGLTAAEDFDLAVSSLGACVWCLQRCHADRELLSLRNFAVSGFGCFWLYCLFVYFWCLFFIFVFVFVYYK